MAALGIALLAGQEAGDRQALAPAVLAGLVVPADQVVGLAGPAGVG